MSFACFGDGLFMDASHAGDFAFPVEPHSDLSGASTLKPASPSLVNTSGSLKCDYSDVRIR